MYLESLIVSLAYRGVRKGFPSNIRDEGKLTMLDLIGVMSRGNQTSYVKNAASAVAPRIAKGSTLVALHRRSAPSMAALINATGTTTLELDETLRHGGGHCAVQVLPGVIALGEREAAPGQHVLNSFICAYELGARLGKLLSPFKSHFHPHGAWAAPAAALGASLVAGLREDQAVEAVRIACNLSITSSFNTALEGATIRDFYAGFAAHNGVLAALLAAEGVTGAKDAVRTALSPAISQNQLKEGRGEEVFEDFRRKFYLSSNHLKLYAACFSVQAPIDAALALRESMRPGDIERIDVFTTRLSSRLAGKSPKNSLAAKFSIPYGVATALTYGAAGLEEFSDAYVGRASLQQLCARVNVLADDEITGKAPEKWGVRLVAFKKDGGKKTVEVEDTVGMRAKSGRTSEAIERKFDQLTRNIYPRKKASRIRGMIGRLEALPDIRILTRMLA